MSVWSKILGLEERPKRRYNGYVRLFLKLPRVGRRIKGSLSVLCMLEKC
jgi:hypothetical protein